MGTPIKGPTCGRWEHKDHLTTGTLCTYDTFSPRVAIAMVGGVCSTENASILLSSAATMLSVLESPEEWEEVVCSGENVRL